MSDTSQRGPLNGTGEGQSRGPVGYDPDSLFAGKPINHGSARGPIDTEGFSMPSNSLTFDGVLIDVPKAYHYFFVCAFHVKYAEKTKYDRNWFSADDIDIPTGDEIKEDAHALAGKAYLRYFETLSISPSEAQRFKIDWAQKADIAKRSIQNKFDKLRNTNEFKVNAAGSAIKFLAGVEFVSTVTIKLTKSLAGRAGMVIDIAYESTISGIDSYAETNSKSDAAKVVLTKVGSEGFKEVLEKTNEGVVSAQTKKSISSLNKTVDSKKKVISGLEKKIEKKLKTAVSNKASQKSKTKATKQLIKLVEKQALEKDVLAKATGKQMAKTAASKAAGNVLNVYFIKKDITEAWEKLNKRYADQKGSSL